MANQYGDTARRKALSASYEEKLKKRKEFIKEYEAKDEIENWKNLVSTGKRYSAFDSAMKNPDTLASECVREYYGWRFEVGVPERDKDVVLYFANRLWEYPYSDSFRRRSYRAKANAAYISKLSRIIDAYTNGISIITDEPLDKILVREISEEALAYLDEYPWRGCGYTPWQVAYALDHHDKTVEDAVYRILTEENGSGSMTTELVQGVLFSHRTDFHELLGKLLLAARLQEGLRQVICENADYGTLEGFLLILKVIDENHLIRFSSVKRAVGTWLGLLTEECRDLERVSEKSVRLIIDCIENENAREEYLASEDAMKIYIALWSYALKDIDEAVRKIASIAEIGSVHQILVAGYFSMNLDLPFASSRIAKIVLKKHIDNEKILAVWLPSFIPGRGSAIWMSGKKDKTTICDDWFEDRAELNEFYDLMAKCMSAYSGKPKAFSPCVFPWHEAKIAKGDLAEILITLAMMSGENEKIDRNCGLIKEVNANGRHLYFSDMLSSPNTPVQRKTVLMGLADKEMYTRQAAFKIASKLQLSEEEYRLMEDNLRFKGADIRKYTMELLMKQGDQELSACVARLIQNSREEVRLGGLDMLVQLRKDEKRSEIADGFSEALVIRAQDENLSSKEKILIESLLPSKQEETAEEVKLFSEEDQSLPDEFDKAYTEICAGTFSEYFPDSHLPDLILDKENKTVSPADAACRTAVIAQEDLKSLSEFIEAHKYDTFVGRIGEETLIGNIRLAHHFVDKDNRLPFEEMWKTWIEKNSITNPRLVRALLLINAYREKTQYTEACTVFLRDVFGAGFENKAELPHDAVMLRVLEKLVDRIPEETRLLLASAVAVWFIKCVPDDKVMLCAPAQMKILDSIEMAHLLAHEQMYLIFGWLKCRNDKDLKNTFPLFAKVSERCIASFKNLPIIREKISRGELQYGSLRSGVLHTPKDERYSLNKPMIGVDAYLYAACQGIISEKQLFAYIFEPENLSRAIHTVTAAASAYYDMGKPISSHDSYKRAMDKRIVRELLENDEKDDENRKLLEYVSRIYDAVVPVILASELKRGDSPAAYSECIHSIARVYGAEYLSQILSALGTDTLDRSIVYWSKTTDRKSTLSHLLSVCIPKETDSADTLRSALTGKKITAVRLIEAALYSPEWIPIIGKYLDINGFESACYYFMAHMNDRFDDKRKAMIARYTPLSQEELNDGAFDVNWFKSAYGSIGEKDFNLIYDAAKYISDGAKHTRARKYADATLGKLDAGETEKTVSDKRNKDLLMAYALIPLAGEDDILRRYLFIQKFRKESKQFGSQRALSEGKAAEMALTNLAINAGYSDSMRLTLRMETKAIDDQRDLLEKKIIDDVSFQIVLDEFGKASLACEKDGKKLKSVPARLKKNEDVSALTGMVKTLTEQYRRTRVMLERAMEDGTVFTFGELSALLSHPVVCPIIQNLVLVSGDFIGFLHEKGLSDDTGLIHALEENDEIRIAHPYDLYRKGLWRNYQKYLFENRISQPFRQVFRELYVKTAEETEMLHSLRYAGNQIQPFRTVSVLKSRRWIADIENGLQKVYYKENIVAQIYALADWFSPADIEAPTLEWVAFSDRRTGKAIRIKDIPEIVFSEVMRDVDLAVSVAHAGGVDPETSHSTMEMRAAILSFILPMFRVTNARIEGRHALVKGSLAEYFIHLGSGVVHRIGGAMIPVLPVHSQHRGKIFLPFADDDPKTAEIISKVLLFAEDEKIKDPMILSEIRRV